MANRKSFYGSQTLSDPGCAAQNANNSSGGRGINSLVLSPVVVDNRYGNSGVRIILDAAVVCL